MFYACIEYCNQPQTANIKHIRNVIIFNLGEDEVALYKSITHYPSTIYLKSHTYIALMHHITVVLLDS